MSKKNLNADQLLMAFSRELNGVQGKGRNYKTVEITIGSTSFSYYFSKSEVQKILKSDGDIRIDFEKSLYLFEEYLEKFIDSTKEESEIPNYVEWIKAQNFKVILKKNDIKKV